MSFPGRKVPRSIITLLYIINKATFQDYRYITDISDTTQNTLEGFLENAERIVLAVDCENSDPYKLCAVLGGIKEAALRGGVDIGKLTKIILIDDVHTVDAWEILKNYVSVPIEHIRTERVNDHKSLVDIQLTAAVVAEHYREGVDSFLLASSDSDFWGLIKSALTRLWARSPLKRIPFLPAQRAGFFLRNTDRRSGIEDRRWL